MTTSAPPRLSHGERTRRDILEMAVTLGAREGLEALTIGRLASAVGMSKGGLFAHFGSKEALQLATVAAAREQFVGEVAGPALTVAPGVAQLRAFVLGYFDYLERRRERGGCFFTAAALEYDDRDGEVREALRAVVEERDALILGALTAAAEAGEISAEADLEQIAFQVSALAVGANVAAQLLRQSDALARARTALENQLTSLSVKPRQRPRKPVRSRR